MKCVLNMYSHHPIYRADREKRFLHGISGDPVNRMMHLSYSSISLRSGKGFTPDKSDDTVNRDPVNRDPVNRMMTVVGRARKKLDSGRG